MLQKSAENRIFLAAATPGRSNNLTSAGPAPGVTPLIIYPNPVTGGTLWLSEATECRVYSASGVLLFSGTDVTEIDVSALPAGMYILVTDDGRAVRFITAGH